MRCLPSEAQSRNAPTRTPPDAHAQFLTLSNIRRARTHGPPRMKTHAPASDWQIPPPSKRSRWCIHPACGIQQGPLRLINHINNLWLPIDFFFSFFQCTPVRYLICPAFVSDLMNCGTTNTYTHTHRKGKLMKLLFLLEVFIHLCRKKDNKWNSVLHPFLCLYITFSFFLSSRLRVTFLMEKGFLHRVKEGFSALQNKYKTKTNAAKQSKQP